MKNILLNSNSNPHINKFWASIEESIIQLLELKEKKL
jgi:hypothetical protein